MKSQAFLAVTIFSIIFAVFVTVQRELSASGVHPIYLNTLIYGIAAFLWGTYLAIFDRKVLKKPSPHGIRLGVVASILASVVADVLILFGLQTGTAFAWSILAGLVPLVTYTLAIFFLGELFALRKIVAIALSILGAVLVLYAPGVGLDFTHGGLFFISAVAVFGVANIFNEKALKFLTPSQMTILRLTTAAVCMVFLMFFFRPALTPVPWHLIFLNSALLVIAINLVNFIMQKTSASFFSVASNMGPLFVLLISVGLLQEWPTALQIFGGVVIVGSIVLFEYAKKA